MREVIARRRGVGREAQAGADGDQHEVERELRVVPGDDRVVDHALDQHRDRDAESGRRERAQQADADETPLHPPLPREMAGGRAEAQVRRIDRTDWCSYGHARRVEQPTVYGTTLPVACRRPCRHFGLPSQRGPSPSLSARVTVPRRSRASVERRAISPTARGCDMRRSSGDADRTAPASSTTRARSPRRGRSARRRGRPGRGQHQRARRLPRAAEWHSHAVPLGGRARAHRSNGARGRAWRTSARSAADRTRWTSQTPTAGGGPRSRADGGSAPDRGADAPGGSRAGVPPGSCPSASLRRPYDPGDERRRRDLFELGPGTRVGGAERYGRETRPSRPPPRC